MSNFNCPTCRRFARRDFLKIMMATSASAMFPLSSVHASPLLSGARMASKVCVTGVKNGSGEKALFEAVQNAARATTDFSWLSRGDTVYIKPAMNSGNVFPATTNPVGIKAMVSLLREKGAGKVIVGDMSGIEHVKLTKDELEGSSRELMTSSGIAKAAIEAGAELHFPEEMGWDAFYEDAPSDATHWSRPIMMPIILKDVDHIIQMPRCGRHVLLGSTLAMKNAVGFWRTDSRLEYHKYAATIQEKTADANTVKTLKEKQRMVLTVGTKVLTTFGPDSGFVRSPETGLVFASESVVAHDMLSLAWLMTNRSAMTEDEMDDASDPYQSQLKVRLANHFVVGLLGSVGDVINSEKLTRNDLNSVWDDRVLNRAFQVFGGPPAVDLVNVEDTVPTRLLHTLQNKVILPSDKKG